MVSRKLVLYLLFGLQLVLHAAPQEFEYEHEIIAEDGADIIDLSAYGEALFGEPDVAETGKLVAAYNSSLTSLNPEELGSYLEGDILIPATMRGEQFDRNGILAQASRWSGGVVPYEIRGDFSKHDLSIIAHAFNEYHKRTCVRFRPRSNEADFISIESGNSGCWSAIGRSGGRQIVNLQSPSCLRNYGTAIHELMHALGFLHEQNRHERDAFVRILRNNVKPKMMINFKKSTAKETFGYGVKYDYASVLHYSPTSFSKNGKPTLEALSKSKDVELMGQRNGFSAGDMKKINAMYKCKSKAKTFSTKLDKKILTLQ